MTGGEILRPAGWISERPGGAAPWPAAADLAVPAVFCPFPPRLSVHVAEVQRYAVEWAVRHRFLGGLAARSAFARARFAHLMARAYPGASQADLCLAVAWLTFMFMLDDHFETALGQRPDRHRAVRDAVLAYLRADERTREPAFTALRAELARPLAAALGDVWSRTRARTGASWRGRFVGHLGGYLAANGWEAGNRVARRTPPVEEYLRMRRHSAATGMFFDLIEVFAGVELPATVIRQPHLRRLRRHADNVVAWYNDLVSWHKELAAGDPHNLVLVVRRQYRLPLREAVRLVVSWHDREVRRFLADRQALSPAARATSGVAEFADGLAYWIRANVDWSRESGRYPAPEPA